MATIVPVIREMLQRRALVEMRPEIAEVIERHNRLFRPSPLFTPPVISELRSGLLAFQSPAYEMAQTWASRQRQLLRVASLFGTVNSPFAISSQMLQRTTEILNSIDQGLYVRSTRQPRELTEEDTERVHGMVALLAPVVMGRPHDEARA
ncbi:hypothetical protein [Streptomyces sp. NBC_01353]|uniref:hypothetical protein n=1 Tax=Streptomyces sp. NBC_01353 TaxID=2903835 RepID=UPI002E34535C|nr:hypothetical protein [Streptomyces sp. NBC_01353]